MNTRLQSVHPVLTSSSITASLRFFERLGFRELFRDAPSDPRYAGVSRDGVELHLQWHDAAQWAGPLDRPTYRFTVSDVDSLYADFLAAGAVDTQSPSPWARPGDTPWRTYEFHVPDPDGNGLQFYEPLRASR
jgi:catechol 2,3-dioxygenase-like lactoylglutathione lyase family enzyme